MDKIRLSITIDENLDSWLDEQVELKRFGSKFHGIALSLTLLRKKIESGKGMGLN